MQTITFPCQGKHKQWGGGGSKGVETYFEKSLFSGGFSDFLSKQWGGSSCGKQLKICLRRTANNGVGGGLGFELFGKHILRDVHYHTSPSPEIPKVGFYRARKKS